MDFKYSATPTSNTHVLFSVVVAQHQTAAKEKKGLHEELARSLLSEKTIKKMKKCPYAEVTRVLGAVCDTQECKFRRLQNLKAVGPCIEEETTFSDARERRFFMKALYVRRIFDYLLW
ncbi:hypothetical protein PROFUN_01923 [Planoprotostelium fungivorum]|uniref:Uncharacterized protein n=1 Tax=Planoprotostelium fungivorum TaxID=1890364 RepID=A0A2P6NZ21_9EUKA|nr:hypothetical protein PROFUN_01923 [Planoprotostelium fungivorum]